MESLSTGLVPQVGTAHDLQSTRARGGDFCTLLLGAMPGCYRRGAEAVHQQLLSGGTPLSLLSPDPMIQPLEQWLPRGRHA